MAGSICWLPPCHTASGSGRRRLTRGCQAERQPWKLPPLQPRQLNIWQASKAGDQALLGRFKPGASKSPKGSPRAEAVKNERQIGTGKASLCPITRRKVALGLLSGSKARIGTFGGHPRAPCRRGTTQEGAGCAEVYEIIPDASERDVSFFLPRCGSMKPIGRKFKMAKRRSFSLWNG